jgi:hypothetical protein
LLRSEGRTPVRIETARAADDYQIGIPYYVSGFSGVTNGPIQHADTLGGLTRAQAHTDADGYAGPWALQTVAFCADKPNGYEIVNGKIVNGKSDESGSEAVKIATAQPCPNWKALLSSGGAVTDIAPGNAALVAIGMDNPISVTAEWNTPPVQPWGWILARGICASPQIIVD